MKAKRRKFTLAFKEKVVTESLKECETMGELSKRIESSSSNDLKVDPATISKWKQEFNTRSSDIFETKTPYRIYEKQREKLDRVIFQY